MTRTPFRRLVIGLAVAMVGSVVHAAQPTTPTPYLYTSTGFLAVTSFTTATSLPTMPAGTLICVLIVQGNPVNYRQDGVAPTATVTGGVNLPLGATLLVSSNNYANFQMIPTTGASTATLDCQK